MAPSGPDGQRAYAGKPVAFAGRLAGASAGRARGRSTKKTSEQSHTQTKAQIQSLTGATPNMGMMMMHPALMPQMVTGPDGIPRPKLAGSVYEQTGIREGYVIESSDNGIFFRKDMKDL